MSWNAMASMAPQDSNSSMWNMAMNKPGYDVTPTPKKPQSPWVHLNPMRVIEKDPFLSTMTGSKWTPVSPMFTGEKAQDFGSNGSPLMNAAQGDSWDPDYTFNFWEKRENKTPKYGF